MRLCDQVLLVGHFGWDSFRSMGTKTLLHNLKYVEGVAFDFITIFSDCINNCWDAVMKPYLTNVADVFIATMRCATAQRIIRHWFG